VLGTRTDGSGLGLAIVKEILQRHQASIQIADSLAKSSAAQGARFEIQIALIASGKP
jgi:two-component system sensor histidine kinase TctE